MRTHPLALTAVALFALTGCYTELDSDDSVAATETTTVEPEPAPVSPGSNMPSGGRSTLGKAKESAKSTVRGLEERQADIEKQLEDDQP